MSIFNEVFDLAAVAAGAGLAGGGGSAMVAWMVSGMILRFIIRTVLTAIITGVGFYFLLGALGFEIVPKDTATNRASMSKTVGNELFAPQALPAENAEADVENERKLIVNSPFRRGSNG